MSEFFRNSQQENAENDNGDKRVGFPGELFLQEDTGKQQRDNTDRGQNGSSDCIHAAKGIHISKLTCGLEYGSQNLVLVLRHRAELHLLGLHEDKQAQSEQGEGQLVAGVGNGLDGLLGNVHEGSIGDVLHQEECVIQESAEGIQQSVQEGHDESENGQFFAIGFLSGGLTGIFYVADAHNTDGD